MLNVKIDLSPSGNPVMRRWCGLELTDENF